MSKLEVTHMIQWKMSAVSFALGALTTVGFVWLRSRHFMRQSRDSARPRPHRPLDERSGTELPFDAEEAARADALHDAGDAIAELDLTEPMMLEPTELQSFDEELFERVPGGERYDAVDPEEVGAEFLQRATEASVDSTPGANGEPPDQPADVAAELPVGAFDAEGNTELRPLTRHAGSPTELSPTEEELEQRRVAREEHAGPGKPHE